MQINLRVVEASVECRHKEERGRVAMGTDDHNSQQSAGMPDD